MTEETAIKVDVAFPLIGPRVPLDHGYALFGALCRVLGDLHGAKWLAVHPLRGVPTGDGMMGLPKHNRALRIRISPSEIPQILRLASSSIELLGASYHLGVSSVFLLTPANSVAARMVVIKGFMEEAPFREAITRQLNQLEIAGEIELRRRRVLQVAGKKVIGFATTIHKLSETDSIKLQSAGLGGRQRMGCGVFVPVNMPGACEA